MRRAHRIVAPASDMSDALSDGGVRESRGRAEAPVSRAGLELTSPTLLLCLGQASENLLYSEEGPVVVSEFGFRLCDFPLRTMALRPRSSHEATNIPLAPGGWIEMQFSFKVNSKGEVTVSDPETKGYPSVSIYSYNSKGDATDVWQQTENGRIDDLMGPRKSTTSDGQKAAAEDAARQCAGGNRAACNN